MILHFKLDQPQNVAQLTYRPFGTRTIKLQISSETQTQLPLRLRPLALLPSDAAAGTFRGFADDSSSLMVSWGGGHETGPCVKAKDRLMVFEEPVALPAGETSHIYFNLAHLVGGAVPETAVLTLEAYQPTDGTIISMLTVTLKRPEVWWDGMETAVRSIVPGEAGRWHLGEGTLLPAYDPRWWPEAVAYVAAPDSFPLIIEQHDMHLVILWQKTAVGIITDNTDPPLKTYGGDVQTEPNYFAFDLFNFDGQHLALRVWFNWLSKQIGNDFFVGRHEVPDAERFDFVIHKQTGEVRFVCTDLHWAEVWGEAVEKPQRVALGLSREMVMKEVLKKTGGTIKKVAGWLGFGDDASVSEATTPHNPIVYVRQRVQQLSVLTEAERNEREKGTEAHVPQLLDTIEEAPDPDTKRNRLVSNDVRLVF